MVVHFKSPVALGYRFKVKLQFSFPGALKTGQDGDAIELGRFKSVSRAIMKISFAQPVEQPGWYWLNKNDPQDNTLQLYPWPPSIGEEKHSFTIDLLHDKISKTVYSFICHCHFKPDPVATNIDSPLLTRLSAAQSEQRSAQKPDIEALQIRTPRLPEG